MKASATWTRSRRSAWPAWIRKTSRKAAQLSWKSASRSSRADKRTAMDQPAETARPTAAPTENPRLPLARFKVIDLTLARAGPSCVRTLADWGADVIRVEPPPEESEASELVGRRDGSDFQNLHRNKRAITLNLKTDEGREILMRLAERADVVV